MSQSLRRGLEILEFLAASGGEATVSAAARQLAVDRSTASRLLATLEERGFVAQDLDTQRYRLGTKLLRLGDVLLEDQNLRSLGHDIVRSLSRETGESAHVAIRVGTDAIFVDRSQSTAVITINTGEVGTHDPLYCTAIGRALLCGMSDDQVRDLLGQVPFRRFTPKTISTMVELLDRLKTVRANGYAFDDEEANVGVHCIAAPVYDHRRRVMAAIGISGPGARVARIGVETLARAVTNSAHELSSRLGYEPVEKGTREAVGARTAANA